MPEPETPARLILLADISTSRLTDAAVDALIAFGVEGMIVSVRENDPALTLHNLQMAQRFPIPPDLYTYLCWSSSPAARVRRNIARYAGLYVTHYLDCEDDGYGSPGLPDPHWFSPFSIIQMVNECMGALKAAGVPYRYYSGPWWHPTATGDYAGWSDVGLWTADYDHNPDLSVWRPYGGWKQPAIKQYLNDQTIGGVTVDLNVMAVP